MIVMIKSITINNFKCFNNETKLDLSYLTVLTGLNNSGKSSIYQMLLGLIQSGDSLLKLKNGDFLPYFRPYGSLFQGGTIEDILNSQKRKLSIQISFYDDVEVFFEYKIRRNLSGQNKKYLILANAGISKIDQSDLNYNSWNTTFRFLQNNQFEVRAENALRILDSEFYDYLIEYNNKYNICDNSTSSLLSRKVVLKNVRKPRFEKGALGFFELPITSIDCIIEKTNRKSFNTDRFLEFLKTKSFDKDFITLVLVDRMLQSSPLLQVEYIGPFRGTPKRLYNIQDAEFEVNFSKLLTDRDLIVKYRTDEDGIRYATLAEAVNFWAEEIFGISSVRISTQQDGIMGSIEVKIDNEFRSINNVGFGVSQILPIIIRILCIPKDVLAIIDEPEIHLHPGLQTKIAKFLCQMKKIHNQILVETHSEYMINYFIYDNLKYSEPDNPTLLYWIKKENGGTLLDAIDYDEFGFVKNQPEGFIDGMEEVISDLMKLRSIGNMKR
jgi:predicted ATPase